MLGAKIPNQKYPARGVENIGGVQGYFEDVEIYCGMGFDREEDVSPLTSPWHGGVLGLRIARSH